MAGSPPTNPATLLSPEGQQAAPWVAAAGAAGGPDQHSNGQDGLAWLGAAAKYEWKDEYGDVGPASAELEQILFGDAHHAREGEHRSALEIEVALDGPVKVKPVRSFDDAALHPVVLQNLKLAGIHKPTPIQAYALPAVALGHDVIGIAQTGSGKTLAYMAPILSKLMGKAKKLAKSQIQAGRAEPLVVIVCPTRELAIQIWDEARRMCYRSMLRPCVAYGGMPLKDNMDDILKGCDLLVATPGRLCDLIRRSEKFSLSRVKFTVLDEADEMLSDDWVDELGMIMAGGDSDEQADHVYMMFSATFPRAARKLARQYMNQDYMQIRVGRPGQSHKNIEQSIMEVDQHDKPTTLWDVLSKLTPGRTLIFCNSKATVDRVDDYLFNKRLPVTSITSDRGQREREDAMQSFRAGETLILVATGVSARGWDISSIQCVINYDLPAGQHGGISEYIHRIGRTARMGHRGKAISFYTERDQDLAQDLVNVLVECACEVPDFLSHLTPEGNIEFNDDSDDEEEASGETQEGWGSNGESGANDGW